jgi:hypothetical protein
MFELGIVVVLVVALIRGRWREIKSWLARRLEGDNKYPQRKDAEQNREIYRELVELRAVINADRVYILRFHNGTEFLPSHPAWRISCTHEVVKHGVTYESARLQGIFVSRIPNIINPLLTGTSSAPGVFAMQCSQCPFQRKCVQENKHIVLIQVDELNGSYCRFHLENQNVKTALFCGLNINGNVFGLAGIDYCDSKVSQPEAIQDIAQQLCRVAERLRFHL